MPPKLDEAVGRAVAYLARQQRPDGTFDHQLKPDGQDAPAGGHRRAVTGLCLLAFLSAGHTPDLGHYGPAVRRAVDALAVAVPDDGYVGGRDEKPMYTQAIVTLALAQAYGVEPTAEKRAKQHAALKRLVAVILKAQAVRKDAPHAGGWRYARDAPDSDLSLSGWNALALRAAGDAGVPVPPEALRRAADYVAACRATDGVGPAFAYQPGGAVQTGTTATGVLCLYLLEHDPRPEAVDAGRTLVRRPADAKALGGYTSYGTFYLVQAAGQAGDDVWAAVARPALDRLVKAQQPDGGWAKDWPTASEEPGRVYRTAMATLTLTVPYRVLPVYQR